MIGNTYYFFYALVIPNMLYENSTWVVKGSAFLEHVLYKNKYDLFILQRKFKLILKMYKANTVSKIRWVV